MESRWLWHRRLSCKTEQAGLSRGGGVGSGGRRLSRINVQGGWGHLLQPPCSDQVRCSTTPDNVRCCIPSFSKPTPILPNSARCSFFATENLTYAMDVLLEAKNFESGQLQNRLIPRLQIKGGPKGTSMGVTFVSMSKGNSGRGQPQCT